MCEEVRKVRNGKLVAAFAALLVVSFAAMNAMPSDTLLAALLQEAVLALVGLAAVGFAVPAALMRCTQSVQQRDTTVRFSAIALLLTGLIGGTITLMNWSFVDCGNGAGLVSAASPSAAGLMENLLLLLGICLLTGLYEESFMRVLGIEAFERAFGQGGAASRRTIGECDARLAVSEHVVGGRPAHPTASGYAAGGSVGIPGEIEHDTVKLPIAFNPAAKRAILVSALLFALLHVGAPDVSAGQLVLLQTALKFGQALLFGVTLGALYVRTRRLWPCAFIHAGFDVLYLAPNVLLTGMMPETYASGAVGDTVLLAVSVLMLSGIVLKICKEIA